MTAKAQKLLEEALELPPHARGELAASLLDSLDDRTDPDADKAWAQEIDRRLDALETGTAKTVPWSVVEKGLSSPRGGRKRR